MNSEPSGVGPEPSERPPFLGEWRNVYTAVLSFLALLIVLFTVFMRAFS